jgi:isocitrate dehydrogenase (NAD+)
MMLDHVGKAREATKLRDAIGQALNAGNVRTGDLGGNATTKAFTQAVVERLA